METKKFDKREALTKYLALILRHKPEIAKIKLDSYGWADINNLIDGMNKNSKTLKIIKSELDEIVSSSNGQFIFNDEKTAIKATSGHTIKIEFDFPEAIDIPNVLYYGTNMSYFEKFGLTLKNSDLIHLSKTIDDAKRNSFKHSKVDNVVLLLDTKKLIAEGHKIYTKDYSFVISGIKNIQPYLISILR